MRWEKNAISGVLQIMNKNQKLDISLYAFVAIILHLNVGFNPFEYHFL